jgi:kumamolisin
MLLTREAYAEQFGADPDDCDRVALLLEEANLEVVEQRLPSRTMVVAGAAAAMSRAFGVSLAMYRGQGGGTFRGRQGPIYVPVGLEGIVQGIFGLDDRAHALPYLQRVPESEATGPEPASHVSFTSAQLAQLYNFPSGLNGQGQTIGVVAFGGGFQAEDLTTYFGALDIRAPRVIPVSVDHASNAPGGHDAADAMVALNIQVVGAVAPGATIVVYFAPNTEQGFVDAIAAAVHDSVHRPSVISICWGAPEVLWTQMSVQAIDRTFQAAAAMGITVVCGSGDHGATPFQRVPGAQAGNHVEFPASSPHVLACGGTLVRVSGPSITDEVVWNDPRAGATGGGFSALFPKPAWQQVSPGNSRGVPDVASAASPLAGYSTRVDGRFTVAGGTGAACSLMTGLVALINQGLDATVGFLNPVLYSLPPADSGFRDIVNGNNNGYSATPGWDPCTGLGSPDGARLLNALVDVWSKNSAPDASSGPANDTGQPDQVSRAYQPERLITSDFWTSKDRLGHAVYADAIAGFIRHAQTRPPLTIGITGQWGSGKTSLMRMVRERLDPADASGKRADIQLTPAGRDQLLHPESRVVRRTTTASDPSTGLSTATCLDAVSHTRVVDDQQLRAIAPELSNARKQTAQDEWRPTVWFNPWRYQTAEQVWAGLGYEIITSLTERMKPLDREHFWLALNLRRVDRQAVRRRVYQTILVNLLPIAVVCVIALVLAIGVALVGSPRIAGALTSLAAVGAAIGALWNRYSVLRQQASATVPWLVKAPDYLTAPTSGTEAKKPPTDNGVLRNLDYESRLGFLHLVQSDMKSVLDLIATDKRPVVVFVDDVDRCSSAVVAHVIEALNLFLAGEFPNCIFVLALEPAVVAAHIEVAYKELAERLNHIRDDASLPGVGWRFLDKIVQLPLRLPAPDAITTFVDSLLGGGQAVPAPQVALSLAQSDGSASSATIAPATTNASVDELAEKITRAGVDIDTIHDVATSVQEKVEVTPSGELATEIRAAARKVVAELLSDDNPEMRRVVDASLSQLPSRNPREIKRFINLFRFYAHVSAERRLSGLPGLGLEAAAKAAILAIRWPHLLEAMTNSPGPGSIWLAHLEGSARTNSPEWTETIDAAGLRGPDAGTRPDPEALQDLREFLGAGPLIGAQSGLL